jgi:hypothetical protein
MARARGTHLLSPFETNPMLSRGSCLTGRNRSHGVDDFLATAGGTCAILDRSIPLNIPSYLEQVY